MVLFICFGNVFFSYWFHLHLSSLFYVAARIWIYGAYWIDEIHLCCYYGNDPRLSISDLTGFTEYKPLWRKRWSTMCNSLSKQNHRTLCSPGEVKLSRQQSTNLPWNPADIHGAQRIYPWGRHLWFWSELVKQLFSWLPWNLVSTSELIVKTLLITYVKFTYHFQFLLLFG